MQEITKFVPYEVLSTLSVLQTAGYDAFLVGGCIRDCLMGRAPHDWDITTSAMPEQVLALFRGLGHTVVETGLKHGTVTVVGNDDSYEVTTFRQDGEYTDGRHPNTIEFCSDVKADLARRDFTINAIAWSPVTGLVDPFDGQKDIGNRIIRGVGNPWQRFQEDALRVMRAIRFAATLNFSVDPYTEFAAKENVDNLKWVSMERKRDELMKMLVGDGIQSVLLNYYDILSQPIPEILPCVGFKQHNPYHIYDVWGHIAATVAYAPKDPIVRLTMLLHDIGKPQCFQMREDGRGHFHGHGKVSAEIAGKVLGRLRFDSKTFNIVVQLVDVHDRFIEPNKKAVRRLLREIGPEQFDRLMEVRKADVSAQVKDKLQPRLEKVEMLKAMKEEILVEKDCFSMKDLAINGRDLIAVGFAPGPKMGIVLNNLLEAVLSNPTLNKKRILLEMAEGYEI